MLLIPSPPGEDILLTPHLARKAEWAFRKRNEFHTARGTGSRWVKPAEQWQSCRCEVIVGECFPDAKWNAFIENYHGSPDYVCRPYNNRIVTLDSKGVGDDGLSLLVKRHEIEEYPEMNEWAFILVSWQRDPIYRIIGWAWGIEAVARNAIWVNNPPAYGLRWQRSELRPLHELQELVYGPTRRPAPPRQLDLFDGAS